MNLNRILYVDDDAALRQIVRDQLAAAGYAIDEAEDGVQGVEKLKSETYDLLLLDINMPGKTGIDVLKYIKDNRLPCKVIMLTGRVGFNVATETLKLGANDYITKPFSIDYLMMAIKRALAG